MSKETENMWKGMRKKWKMGPFEKERKKWDRGKERKKNNVSSERREK